MAEGISPLSNRSPAMPGGSTSVVHYGSPTCVCLQKAIDLGESEGLSLEVKDSTGFNVLYMHTKGLAPNGVTGHPLFSQ